MDEEYDVLGGYLPSFVRHLSDTGARLGLRTGSHASQDRAGTGGSVTELDVSTWTPAEHDAFFRAVSVYSRWRPDLIAACVPTKSKWDVWMYLEALEEGATTLAMQQGGEDVDMQVDRSSSDSRSLLGSDMDKDEYEDVCEPALEVSQAWIDLEERMAAWIADEEYHALPGHDAVADTEDDERDKPPKRKRGRPRGTGKGRAQSRARQQTVSNEGSSSPPPVGRSPSDSPELTLASARKREALMTHLEVPHLLVLDNILREDEEAMKAKSKRREVSDTATTPIGREDERIPHARDAEASGLPGQRQGTSEASQPPSDVVIDPVLLVLSGGADPAACQTSVSNESPSTSRASAHVLTAQGASSLANASSSDVSPQPETGNMFTFSFGNTTFANPNPTASVESDLSLFSPRSRRRIQKRLYMRRKRASEKGIPSGGVMDIGIERLKPGRKVKSGRSKTPAISDPAPCSEAPSEAKVELSENVSKTYRGLTLPYKLKARFAELGVDAAYLRGQGMDLLNMNALGRLMELRSSLEHGEEEADETATTQFIDAELIRHLQAAMISFVTDIIHRAIVWRELEIRLKQRSQAWRHGDQITISAVEHAVDAIGARHRSHKEYFKSLEAVHCLSTEPSSATANAPEEPHLAHVSVDPDVGTEQSTELPSLSLHRDVYTPLIHPPSTWRMGSLTCLTRTYEREAARTRRGRSAEMEEDQLMSDQTDEEALEAELEEEDEADLWDMELACTHEQDLWGAVTTSIGL